MKVRDDGTIDISSLTYNEPVECWVVNLYWLVGDVAGTRPPIAKRWATSGAIYWERPKDVHRSGSRHSGPIYATEEAAWKEAECQFNAWVEQRKQFIARRGVPLPVEKKSRKKVRK
ncbi:MAG: hypothetical protein KGR25_00050 [Chloroflexi bacterium]|nr:hypothetical protein [Chloroflexota bacterium]